MIQLPEIDGEVKAIAGFNKNDKPIEGTTTNETINNFFGDLWDGNKPIKNDDYQAILSRCDDKNWKAWKASWKMWKDDGLLD